MPNILAQALFHACAAGDAAAVSRLLPAGGTPRNLSGPRFQTPDGPNTTPLMVAALNGRTEIVRMLLALAPNTAVDHADARGFTALLMVTLYHHADILRLLVDHGANLNFAGPRGDTPLRLSVQQIHPDGRPRDPDPDGARRIATVRALLRLGAGTLPPHTPAQPFSYFWRIFLFP